MKKHNIVKVVLITILVFFLLTWILPAAYYSGQYAEQGRVQMGLFDLFNYPLTALSYFGYIAFFIILVGGFYGVLYKIPAYRTFLDKIVQKVKGREKIALSVMITVIALLVSVCGLQIGIALFIPFVISLVLLMGYDKIVAAFVTVGSITAGLIGGTIAFQNYAMLTTSLSLKFDYQIWVRLAILLVAIVLVIFNTLMYIKRNNANVKGAKKVVKKAEEKEEVIEVKKVEKVSNKKNSTSSKQKTSSKSTNGRKSTSKSSNARKSVNKAALKDEDIIVVKQTELDDNSLIPQDATKKHKTWPFVVIFGLLSVLMTLAFIAWGAEGFNVKVFDNATKAVSEFKIFGFQLFGKLLGTVNSFGNWTIMDLTLPIILSVVLLALIYKVKVNDIFDGFVEGAKRSLGVAFISILVYTILVIVTYHPFQLVIYKAILGLAKGFNIATTTVVAILASLFNADPAYAFQSVIPYFTSVVTNADNYATVGIIFQSIYGVTMLIAPTSLVLMGILSYLKISYGEWLKNIWKLLVEIFVILLIIFIILALV